MTTTARRVRHRPPTRRSGRPEGGQLIADRSQLLAAAEETIRANGPEVTMEAIAAASTVTKPILYRAIGDRDAVVAALAERFVDRLNAAGAVAMAGAQTPRDGLRRMVTTYVEIVEAERNVFLFVTAGGSGNDRLAQALRLADRSASLIAAELKTHRAAAGLDPAVGDTWAYGMIGAMQYVTLWWLRDPRLDSHELAEQLTTLLWSGLGGEPRDPARLDRTARTKPTPSTNERLKVAR